MHTYIHTYTPVRGGQELPLPPPAPVKQAPLQTQAGQGRARALKSSRLHRVPVWLLGELTGDDWRVGALGPGLGGR